MPLATVKFAPGFDKQSTAYGAEGKWIDGENIRFRYGQPEKIGGWVKLVANKLYGAVRAQFAWSALDGTRFLALGTDKKLYLYTEGAIHDITPIRDTERQSYKSVCHDQWITNCDCNRRGSWSERRGFCNILECRRCGRTRHECRV